MRLLKQNLLQQGLRFRRTVQCEIKPAAASGNIDRWEWEAGARAPLQRGQRVAQQHQRVYSLERVLAARLRERRLEALCRLEMVAEASVRASHGAVAGAVECGGQREGAGAENSRQAFSDVSSAPRVA